VRCTCLLQTGHFGNKYYRCYSLNSLAELGLQAFHYKKCPDVSTQAFDDLFKTPNGTNIVCVVLIACPVKSLREPLAI